MEIEKIKKGLQAHVKGCGRRSNYCDFMECPYRIGDESCDIKQMCIDAIALLEEYQEKQEGLPPAWQDRTQEHICQKCGGIVWQEDNYCSKCGQKVKWNDR